MFYPDLTVCTYHGVWLQSTALVVPTMSILSEKISPPGSAERMVKLSPRPTISRCAAVLATTKFVAAVAVLDVDINRL